MKKYNHNTILLSFLLLILWSCASFIGDDHGRYVADDSKEYSYYTHERIDYQKLLFGIEYSFQDEEIVAEPGRETMRTPHKGKKFDDMWDAYSQQLGIDDDSITKDTAHGHFKPGYQFMVPGDGSYTINMEPVTVEVNTTPKHIHEVHQTSSKIFAAAEQADLVPYVNPAAERSGMGHIHVGAKTLRESPLYQNPLLLRNILVYYHQHPSLLYGFAEAYDIGDNSNIETFHIKGRQEAFKKVVEDFDEWYFQTKREGGDLSQGLAQFLRILEMNEPPGQGFCHRYRVVNLEHLCKLRPNNLPLDQPGKFTVEHRSFRPQKNADTAHANAHLLIDLYEKLSTPDFMVPFEEVSETEYKRFWTGSMIQNDWEQVKRFIDHKNIHSDAMITETVQALKIQTLVPSTKIDNATIQSAFSKKEDKGKAFELKVESEHRPVLEVGGREVEFERIVENNKTAWVSYLDSKSLGVTPTDIINESSFNFKGYEPARVLKGFWAVKQKGTNHQLVFPRYEGQSYEQALYEYEQAIKNNDDLKKLLKRITPLSKFLSGREVTKISVSDLQAAHKPNMLLLANRAPDYRASGRRIKKFTEAFDRYGASNYILPISIDEVMSEQEARDFRSAINNSFHSVVALGGADIDPALYGEKVTYSRMVNPTRDLSEYKILKSYNKSEKGATFGICRGAQLCAVVQGESMVQDLEIEGGIKETQTGGVWRSIEVTKESNELLYHMVGSKTLNTLNYHHQMIDIQDGSKIKDFVYRGEGDQKVLKAYTFTNNRGFGVQFHPEFMDNEDGENILKGMVRYTKALRTVKDGPVASCGPLMSSFLD
jgi:putative glutamine amidotransferase